MRWSKRRAKRRLRSILDHSTLQCKDSASRTTMPRNPGTATQRPGVLA